MQELADRVVVVTGGASGIGRGIAEAFAAVGAKLVIADTNRSRLDETLKALPASAEALAVATDVRRAADVEALAEHADRAFGHVHVLCNNAGVACSSRVFEASLDDYDWIFDTNVRGTLHGLRAFVPRMLAGGEEGHIVNTASMLALASAPLTGLYGASKHAVLAITESLRADFAISGISLGVSVLCPGPVRTNVSEEPGRPSRPVPAASAPVAAVAAELVRVVAEGMDPRAVGDCVVDAVRRNRFWILPALEHFENAERRLAEIRVELGRSAARDPPAAESPCAPRASIRVPEPLRRCASRRVRLRGVGDQEKT